MTFLNVSLAYLGKIMQPPSLGLSFGLTANYGIENEFSLTICYLTTKCVPVSPQVKSFDVGDEYMSTGRNVSTISQFLAGNPSQIISPKFVL